MPDITYTWEELITELEHAEIDPVGASVYTEDWHSGDVITITDIKQKENGDIILIQGKPSECYT